MRVYATCSELALRFSRPGGRWQEKPAKAKSFAGLNECNLRLLELALERQTARALDEFLQGWTTEGEAQVLHEGYPMLQTALHGHFC